MKIEIKNVTKKFKDITALESVNMVLDEGKIYGFVGHNGSGKSVLLKIICAFYEPTSGEVLFDGVNVIKENSYPPDTRAFIEKPNFLPEITGRENLLLLAQVQNKIGEKEVDDILKVVGLEKVANKKYHQYSLGMKQKLGIAQVLMEGPKIMIFDEPFNGLDDESAKKIRNILLQEKKKGKIIILATHIKEDVSILCDEIYKFNDGVVTKEKVKK